MITMYEVYNKFDGVVYKTTTTEQTAYSIKDNLNNAFGDIDPFNYPWLISSRVYDDSYKLRFEDED